jgi:hypothetical protein
MRTVASYVHRVGEPGVMEVKRCVMIDGVWYREEKVAPDEYGSLIDRQLCGMDHPMMNVAEQIWVNESELGGAVVAGQSFRGLTAREGRGTYIDAEGVHIRSGDKGCDIEPATDDARYILERLPNLIEEFLQNNAKYARAQSGHDLGVKGIIPDINRKFSVLVSREWNNEPDAGRDSTDEIIGDMIGHLLLMLAKRREV